MVSNYVKKGILSHPVKKKYTRDQIASLLYIVVSKTVLSMENNRHPVQNAEGLLFRWGRLRHLL